MNRRPSYHVEVKIHAATQLTIGVDTDLATIRKYFWRNLSKKELRAERAPASERLHPWQSIKRV